MKNEIVLKPSYWASVSGGKDSLFMLNLILHNLDKYPLDGVVHFELEIDYPFIKNVIDYMENECKKHGIKFIRIKPRITWKELYKKYGFPTSKARWCNSKYKLDAKRQTKEYLKEQGMYLISYIGYCADEIKRYENRKDKNEIYPLVDFGIEEESILEWARNIPIFNDYYKYNKRCGCMFCPMASMKETAYLLKYYPDKYNELMMLAKETECKREKELGQPFSVFSSNPRYNADYRDKRVKEKYIDELEEKIKRKEVDIDA